MDASKDQTEGESQLDSLLDEIDEINGANDRDGATDQDVVQIERKNNASRAKKIAREQAVRLQLQQDQVAVAENEARELASRAGGGNRGESECGADAAAVEAGAEAGVETGAAEAAGTEAASTDQMDAISQLELLLGGS